VTPLTLLHLTFTGPNKASASIEFGQHLTVIYGASDTGKSFVVEAIDYMLGASKLKQISEAKGYTRILLGLLLADGRTVTLVRSPDDNKVHVLDGDHRRFTGVTGAKPLNLRHSGKARNNLSRYLLELIGADGRNLLKNQRGERLSLSFRHLAHLCVISETQMASPRSPVLTSGQATNATAEKSAFRVLLTGRDDEEGVAAATEVEKKVEKGKIELLDQLIAATRDSLTLKSNESELRNRLGQVEGALSNASAGIEQLVAARSAAVDQARAFETRISDNRTRAAEVRTLLARFQLLRQQYESDLARLQMVAEAGNLLGYFRTGVCVFCGAEPEHQRADHRVHETTQLQAAVDAETRKTTELHTDLLTTIDDLSRQLDGLDKEHTADISGRAQLRRRVADLDERLTPLNNDNDELLALRTRIQTDLTVHAQIQRLEDLKADLSSTTEQPAPTRPNEIPANDLAEFQRLIQQTLLSWRVPGNNVVTYDQNSAEISVDGRARHTRGKGMRSIIHAAFSVALARYTEMRALPHPGFVVLDSPVLTYREPHENDVALPHNVVEHFYRGLIDGLSTQTIVVENGDPPRDLDRYATVYAFSTKGSDRAGFFPVPQTD
jgi:hypothetical protein